jgi:hypothetical protein
LPVIAGRIGGNPELIEDGVNGTLFSPGDMESLPEKMGVYLQNPTIATDHGMAARETTVNKFTIDKMVSAYEGVLAGYVVMVVWPCHSRRIGRQIRNANIEIVLRTPHKVGPRFRNKFKGRNVHMTETRNELQTKLRGFWSL